MSDSGEMRTYGELEKIANKGAHLIRSAGLFSGDTIALLIDNSLAYFDVYWAAQRCGLFVVPVAVRLTFSEIAYILENSGAGALVASTSHASVVGQLMGARATFPELREFFSIDGSIDSSRDWREEIASLPETPIKDEQSGIHMAYSSGTTGRPKGLRNPLHGGPADSPNQLAEHLTQHYGVTHESIYLSPAPIYHTAPLVWCTSIQRLGGTVVIMPCFDPEAFLAAIQAYSVTDTQVVPTMFVRLLKLSEEVRRRYDLSSLRHITHAAAPCPVPIKRAVIEWLGPIVNEYYGASEGNGSTFITSEEWLRKPGSVGRASWGVIHICDDDGRELPPRERGTVFFEGGLDFKYHGDDGKTVESRNPLHPRWSTVGDIGWIDEDDYLYLSDRKDFMIISGGLNIYPQEAEDVLIAHPEVADAAVLGVPNADLGEEVKAVVQPLDWARAGTEFAGELEAWCRRHLSIVKCPRSIDFEQALPRADNGKLYKKALRARYWPAASPSQN